MRHRIAIVLILLAGSAQAGLSPMDREDLADIQGLISKGRAKEARAMLATCLARTPGGAVGARYDRVEPFLALAGTLGVPAENDALVAVMREDGVALAEQARTAGDVARAELLRAAVRCLKRIPSLDGEGLYQRGWCQLELGEPAAARADLAAAVALMPGHVDARGALARTEWRLGRRRAALETVLTGLRKTPSRGDAELLASMLRAAKHGGQVKRAGEIAGAWARGLDDVACASPLRTLVAEIQLEQGDLDAAVDTFAQVVAEDRPWLLGGLVRTARARARAGNAEGVLAALRKLPLERDRMPAPFLKLAGDIALSRQQNASAVRHYAAALTAGELEARELAARAKSRLGEGSITALLAGKEPTYDTANTDPGAFIDPLAAGGLFFSIDPQTVAADLLAPPEVGAAWREPAARRAAYALAVMKSPRFTREQALQLAVDQATPIPARRKMVHAYLSGDIATAKSELDAFSLVSWQVIRPGVVGALRVAPPGSGAANVEPLTQTTAPAALDSVGQALAALNDPSAAEQTRLAKLMEVAGQRTPDTETLEDPVAIDLDGNGRIDLSAPRQNVGAATFDLEGRGRAREVQWLLTNRDGWLCEDADGDGQITSGLELFGTAGGYTDGFEKLARRDRDNDGVLSATELAGLSVWRERRDPGVVNEGELIPVEQAGVTSITVPRVGLRTTAIVNGTPRLCAEVWPEAANPRVAQDLGPGDLEGI